MEINITTTTLLLSKTVLKIHIFFVCDKRSIQMFATLIADIS